MPWLPFFVDENDKKTLVDWLNSQDEIAFIVSTGFKKWKTVSTVDNLENGNHQLWHMRSGDLPRYVTESGEDWMQWDENEETALVPWSANELDGFISNPWEGWTSDSTSLLLGEHPGIFHLDLWTRHVNHGIGRMIDGEFVLERRIYEENKIGLSGFSWSGSRLPFKVPPQHTRDWWENLKRWIAGEAKLLASIPEWEDEGELIEKSSFYAFPAAYLALRNGMSYCSNGFDLTEGLQ